MSWRVVIFIICQRAILSLESYPQALHSLYLFVLTSKLMLMKYSISSSDYCINLCVMKPAVQILLEGHVLYEDEITCRSGCYRTELSAANSYYFPTKIR